MKNRQKNSANFILSVAEGFWMREFQGDILMF